MFKKLKLTQVIQFLIFIFLLSLSFYFFQFNNFLRDIAYLVIFASLYILFEKFNFQLFTKILLALFLGIMISIFELVDREALIKLNPVGSVIFMNLLTMALIPLVFSSILIGIANLSDAKRLGKIGLRTVIFYLSTTAIAIIIGMILAQTFKPGKNLHENPELKVHFEKEFQQLAEKNIENAQKNKQTLFEGFIDIFPKNIMETVSKTSPNMLQLIFFTIICGIALLQISDKSKRPVIDFFNGIMEMSIKVIIMVMRIAPYGVFALIASQIAKTQSVELLVQLLPYSLIVIIALLIHFFLLNIFVIKILLKKSFKQHLKNIQEVMITAFSTSSSGATMPLTIETCNEKLKIKEEVSGFVIPLGATINMDGTALWQGVSAIFLANIYGVGLDITSQIMVVVLVVLASIGTAAVPGVGIVMLTIVLEYLNLPAQGIIFILPVNNLLDMFRTVLNVTGDIACAVYIDSQVDSEIESVS